MATAEETKITGWDYAQTVYNVSAKSGLRSGYLDGNNDRRAWTPAKELVVANPHIRPDGGMTVLIMVGVLCSMVIKAQTLAQKNELLHRLQLQLVIITSTFYCLRCVKRNITSLRTMRKSSG